MFFFDVNVELIFMIFRERIERFKEIEKVVDVNYCYNQRLLQVMLLEFFFFLFFGRSLKVK